MSKARAGKSRTFFGVVLWDLPLTADEARALDLGPGLGVGSTLPERQRMVLDLYPDELLRYEHER